MKARLVPLHGMVRCSALGWLRVLRDRRFLVTAVSVLGVGLAVSFFAVLMAGAVSSRSLAAGTIREFVFIRPLDQLVPANYEDYLNLRSADPAVSPMALTSRDSSHVKIGRMVRSVKGEMVAGDYFEALSGNPAIGRLIDARDQQVGATAVVVLSQDFWRSVFDSDPSVVGKHLQLDVSRTPGRYGIFRDYTVIGVAPLGFRGLGSEWDRTEYWVSISARSQDHADWLRSIGGVPRRSVALSQAVLVFGRPLLPLTALRNQLADQSAAFRNQGLQRPPGWSLTAFEPEANALPLSPGADPTPLRLIRVVMFLSAAILFTSVFNASGIFLARSLEQSQYFSVRRNLGGTNWHLVVETISETGVVVAIAGILAFPVAWAATVALALSVPGFPTADVSVVRLPIAWQSVFTCVVIAAVSYGVIGAVRIVPLMRQSGLVPGKLRPRGTWPLGAQVGISVALVMAAVGLSRSLAASERLERGYSARGRFAVDVMLPMPTAALLKAYRSDSDESRATIEQEWGASLHRLTSIVNDAERAGYTVSLVRQPASGLPFPSTSGWFVPRGTPSKDPLDPKWLGSIQVSPTHFDVMDIKVLHAGPSLRASSPVRRVAVSLSAAMLLWGRANVVGEACASYDPERWATGDWMEVAGVVTDVTDPLNDAGNRAVAYVIDGAKDEPEYTTILAVGKSGQAPLLQRLTETGDTAVLIAPPRSVEDRILRVTASRRSAVWAAGACAALALFLAAFGVYGITASMVKSKEVELGVRSAIGAGPSSLILAVTGGLLRGGAAGILVGTGLAFVVGGLTNRFVGLTPILDFGTTAAALGIVLVCVVVGAYVPLRRAINLDVARVLRSDSPEP